MIKGERRQGGEDDVNIMPKEVMPNANVPLLCGDVIKAMEEGNWAHLKERERLFGG